MELEKELTKALRENKETFASLTNQLILIHTSLNALLTVSFQNDPTLQPKYREEFQRALVSQQLSGQANPIVLEALAKALTEDGKSN